MPGPTISHCGTQRVFFLAGPQLSHLYGEMVSYTFGWVLQNLLGTFYVPSPPPPTLKRGK